MKGDIDARRLGGGLLLWSLLPFPFVYVIFAPFWMVAGVAGLWRLLRPQVVWRPSTMTQNMLGIVTLAIVLVAGGLRVGPLRPLGHLLLLLTALRVATIDDLRGLRRSLPAIFLVGIVGIVSAVHVSVAPYLLISVIVWWYAGMWLFLLQIGEKAGAYLGRPQWAHVVTAGTVAAVLAIPVFLVVPRLGSPFFGGAFGGESGFSDSVELARRGSISENERPAMYVSREDGQAIPVSRLRLRAAVYEMSSAAVWTPRRSDLYVPEIERGIVWLTEGRRSLGGAVALDISTVERTNYLFLPPGTIAVETTESVLLDSTGGVALARRDGGGAQYRAWVVADAVADRDPPEERDTHLPVHDQRVCDLAEEVAASADLAEDKAAMLESWLEAEYAYSLEGGSMGGSRDPVAWFLFERRRGHCEFFAATLVVLLRHQGVPARMVIGFHGGVSRPGETTVVVRQANAHAWVEVWLGEERGWVVFDPTPAEGVDGLGSLSRIDRLKIAWQSFEDFFDRRILTFGLDEQVGIVSALTEAAALIGRWFVAGLRWLALVPAVLAVLWLLLGGREAGGSRSLPASRAILRLSRRLTRRGVMVSESATIRRIGKLATKMWPQASPDIDRLVGLAEDEQYGPAHGRNGSRRVVRGLWTSINRKVRRNPPAPV